MHVGALGPIVCVTAPVHFGLSPGPSLRAGGAVPAEGRAVAARVAPQRGRAEILSRGDWQGGPQKRQRGKGRRRSLILSDEEQLDRSARRTQGPFHRPREPATHPGGGEETNPDRVSRPPQRLDDSGTCRTPALRGRGGAGSGRPPRPPDGGVPRSCALALAPGGRVRSPRREGPCCVPDRAGRRPGQAASCGQT